MKIKLSKSQWEMIGKTAGWAGDMDAITCAECGELKHSGELCKWKKNVFKWYEDGTLYVQKPNGTKVKWSDISSVPPLLGGTTDPLSFSNTPN